MRYSNEFKLQCIQMYYQGKYPETPEGIKTRSFHDLIREWVRRSEKTSLDGVQHKSRNRIWTPEEVKKAYKAGAFSVVIGSAITRPQLITKRFVKVTE